ncbi:MAG: DUF2779 domain-containing protein [Bacteroidetes bacterium]|nr:DUF2779 domain-containing protein [Bacteroidota bacterium]
MKADYILSKTSFLKFEQCDKAFFLYKNYPYLRDKLSIDKQLTFKRGHDVGFFAQQLFSGGIDVSKEARGATAQFELTKKLIENKTPVIYEATFMHNGVLIMVDILTFDGENYTAYEVKSSLKVSEVYIKDACLQYYVLKASLSGFDDLFLVTLNDNYVLNGEIEVKKLFKKRSVKEQAEKNIPYFIHKISEAYFTLEKNIIPNVSIGERCFRPYQCDFFGSCWKNTISETSIFNLPQVNKAKVFEWFNAGIKEISQVGDEMLEKENAIIAKKSFLNNTPFVNQKNIQQFLSRIKLPVTAMDMEIWNPAIPELQGTKPFEQNPFLVCFYDGENYFHFFSDYKHDDRKLFAEKLIELSENYASILVYDKSLEVNIINALIKNFPEHENALQALKSKIVDVFDVFVNMDYYHPAFKNNFSLKGVSLALMKEIQYSKITSGMEAMSYYQQYRLLENEIEKQSIEAELIEYCNTDSFATFKLFEFLTQL